MSEHQCAMGADLFPNLTHEGRNALQQIQAGLRLLRLMMGSGQDEASEILDDLAQPIRRLERLFADIEDYSGPLQVNVTVCDAGEAWRTACARLNGRGTARQLAPCRVRGDPLLLEEAFCRIAECLVGRPPDPARIDVCSDEVDQEGPTVRITLRGECGSEKPTSRASESVSFAIAERLVEAQGGKLRRVVGGSVREVSLLLRKVLSEE